MNFYVSDFEDRLLNITKSLKGPTNGEIIDLYGSTHNLSECSKLIAKKYSTNLDHVSMPTLQNKIKRLHDKQKKLKRNKEGEQLQLFRDCDFTISTTQVTSENPKEDEKLALLREGTRTCVTENRMLKDTVTDIIHENERLDDQVYLACKKADVLRNALYIVSENKKQSQFQCEKDVSELKKSCNNLDEKYNDLSLQMNKVTHEAEKLKNAKRKLASKDENQQKKIKRRNETIQRLNEDVHMLTEKNCELQENLRQTNDKFATTQDKLNNVESDLKKQVQVKLSLQKKVSYLKRKINNEPEKVNDTGRSLELECQNSKLRKENLDLRQLNDLLEKDVVRTFHDGR